jgi:mRNA interferase YafQ
LKKPASKRANLPRRVDFARSFLRDWDRLSRSGRYDMRRLKEAMLLLAANDTPLRPEWKDHPLKGNWSGHHECHGGGSKAASGGSRAATIGGDFLLIYYIDEAAGPGGTLVFVRAGTHGELFREQERPHRPRHPGLDPGSSLTSYSH